MTATKFSPLRLAVGGGALPAVLAVGLVLVLGGDGEGGGGDGGSVSRDATAGVPAFELKYPSTWERVEPPAADGGDQPDIALERKGGDGLLLLRLRGPVVGDLDEMARDLHRDLARDFEGYRHIDSGTVETKAGTSMLVSWADTETGRQHSTLLVPAGRRSFILDAATPVGAEKVAAMFARFEAEHLR
jgi:hypothetical protein